MVAIGWYSLPGLARRGVARHRWVGWLGFAKSFMAGRIHVADYTL